MQPVSLRLRLHGCTTMESMHPTAGAGAGASCGSSAAVEVAQHARNSIATVTTAEAFREQGTLQVDNPHHSTFPFVR